MNKSKTMSAPSGAGTDKGMTMCERSYNSGQRDLAKEVVETFGALLAAPRHARDCPVTLHEQHVQTVFGKGVRKGKSGIVSEAARGQFNRDLEEMLAKQPACACSVQQAVDLMARLRLLAA